MNRYYYETSNMEFPCLVFKNYEYQYHVADKTTYSRSGEVDLYVEGKNFDEAFAQMNALQMPSGVMAILEAEGHNVESSTLVEVEDNGQNGFRLKATFTISKQESEDN